MTPEQKELVQSSWAKVGPIADQAAEIFYGKLFEADPEVKPLFANSDMKELINSIKEVRAVGDHQVEIETNGPNPILPANLTDLFIIQKTFLASSIGCDVTDKGLVESKIIHLLKVPRILRQ